MKFDRSGSWNIPTKNISQQTEANLSDWTAKLLNYQSRALIIAKQTQKLNDERHLAIAPNLNPTEFPDNKYVLVEYVGGNAPSKTIS